MSLWIFGALFAVALFAALLSLTHGWILLALPAWGIFAYERRRRRRTAALVDQHQRHEAQVHAEAQRHRTEVERATHLAPLLLLTPTQFEHSVCDVLNALGFRLEHRGRVRDRGVDLQGFDPAGLAVVVQCKQYNPSRSVSGPEVRNFLGTMWQHGVMTGLFVTTASYSAEAVSAADGKPLHLIDGTSLVQMAQQALGRQAVTFATEPYGRHAQGSR